MLLRKLDEVFVFEKCTGAKNDCDLSVRDKWSNDRSHERARRALDHNVCNVGERFNRQKPSRLFQLVQPRPVLCGILRGDGGKHQSVYAAVQRLDHPGSDSPQTGHRNPQIRS